MSKLPEIASLWIGDHLSWLEQLCLKSFADIGHHTTLYSYSHIDNLPDNIHQVSAEEIYPSEPMLRHVRTGSPAIHADMFRLNMLKKTNKIWVDADMYCYRPFDFKTKWVFGWEKPGLVCNAVLGLPKNSKALSMMMNFFEDEYAIGPWLRPWQQRELEIERDAGNPVHFTAQNWGFTGPTAVTHFLQKSGEIKHARKEQAFYPVAFKNRNRIILSKPNVEQDDLTEDTYGVHFWARRMKPRLEEKENNWPRVGSFMRGLLEKHGINPDDAPIPARKKTDEALLKGPEFCANLAIEGLRAKISVSSMSRKYLVDEQFINECVAKLVNAAPDIFRNVATNLEDKCD